MQRPLSNLEWYDEHLRFDPLFSHCTVLHTENFQIKKQKRPEIKIQRRPSRCCREVLKVRTRGVRSLPSHVQVLHCKSSNGRPTQGGAHLGLLSNAGSLITGVVEGRSPGHSRKPAFTSFSFAQFKEISVKTNLCCAQIDGTQQN